MEYTYTLEDIRKFTGLVRVHQKIDPEMGILIKGENNRPKRYFSEEEVAIIKSRTKSATHVYIKRIRSCIQKYQPIKVWDVIKKTKIAKIFVLNTIDTMTNTEPLCESDDGYLMYLDYAEEYFPYETRVGIEDGNEYNEE